MIITRTPYRISFFGGGTDYPSWYRKNGGQVLSTTIDKYVYITCRYLPPFFDHRVRLAYSEVEECYSADELQHPSARAVLRFLNINDGVEIHYDGDLPAKSGMGSSSVFVVGLMNLLNNFQGKKIKKKMLAQKSIHFEQKILKDVVGSQDQIAVTHGGFNNIKFLKSGKFKVVPMTIPKKRYDNLQSHLMLFFTGISRISSKIAIDMINNIDSKAKEISLIDSSVNKGIHILTNENLDIIEFGILLDQAWQIKKTLSNKVSNPRIDSIYKKAIQAGAIGGKVLGAGGGGFLFMIVSVLMVNINY